MSDIDKTRFAVDWEKLKGNLIWQVFRAKIDQARDYARDKCSNTTDEIDLRRNQGKVEAFRHILGLMEQPEKLLDETTAKAAS